MYFYLEQRHLCSIFVVDYRAFFRVTYIFLSIIDPANEYDEVGAAFFRVFLAKGWIHTLDT
jgi:hypothetical protein